MKWEYFLKIRKVNIKRHFSNRNIKTKKEIRDYLNNNSFTFLESDVENIYDCIKPKEKEKSIDRQEKIKDVKIVLPQKKKNLRRSSKRKSNKNVSGSMDTRRNS